MVIAIFKSNRRTDPEFIRVHKYSDNSLHVEAIGNSYAHEVGYPFQTLSEVQDFLSKRCPFGYTVKDVFYE